jgi:hypothetical protein
MATRSFSPERSKWPRVELGAVRRPAADRQIEREFALLGNANALGAGEPVSVGADRHRPGRVRRHSEPNEDGIIVLEHVVHQSGDREAGGHWIAERTHCEAVGKLPIDLHRQAGVSGVLPVAMPALLRAHVDGEVDLAAWGRGPLGDQLRNDVLRGGDGRHEQERE